MCFKYTELLNPPIARAAYSDRTAWLLAEMSRIAYGKFEENEEEMKKLKADLSKAAFELVSTFSNKGTQAFLAKRENDKMAVLAFRGTEQDKIEDIIADLDARFYKNTDGSKTHQGFQGAFEAIEASVKEECKKVESYSLYVTGHSLGGAISLIATKALDADNLAACYTFGSPKVGNSEFGDTIKPPIYRIVNTLDVVPTVPFTYLLDAVYYLFGFLKIKAAQNFIQKFRGYEHHGDMRFLTECGIDYDKVRVVNNYSEIKRSIRLFAASIKDKTVGVKYHSLDEYCEKLAQYALKRKEVK